MVQLDPATVASLAAPCRCALRLDRVRSALETDGLRWLGEQASDVVPSGRRTYRRDLRLPVHALGGDVEFRKAALGSRVRVVVTDLGVYHLVDGELQLDALHEGVTLDQVREAMGWSPRVSPNLGRTASPSPDELRLIRDELDPAGVYTK